MEKNDIRGPIRATWGVPDNEKIEQIKNKIDKKKKKNKGLAERVISWFTNKTQKTDNQNSIIKFMSIDPTKDAKQNWARIGRGALHTAPYNLETEKTEIKRGANGTINCTVWSTLLSWWLNMNGIPAKRIAIPGHELVIVPTRALNENNKILLYTLEVSENTNSVADAKFIMKPIGQYLKLWTSLGYTKNGYTNIPGIIFDTLKKSFKTKKQKCIKDWIDLYNSISAPTVKKQNQDDLTLYHMYRLPYEDGVLTVPINIENLENDQSKQTNLTAYTECLLFPQTYEKYLKGTLKIKSTTSSGLVTLLLEAEGQKSIEKWGYVNKIG
jgi:hypothetical protein